MPPFAELILCDGTESRRYRYAERPLSLRLQLPVNLVSAACSAAWVPITRLHRSLASAPRELPPEFIRSVPARKSRASFPPGAGCRSTAPGHFFCFGDERLVMHGACGDQG